MTRMVKRCHQRHRPLQHKNIKLFSVAMALLMAGVAFLSCNGAKAAEKTNKIVPHSKSSQTITPDLGLKKVNFSNIHQQPPVHSNEMAATWSAQCLFGQKQGRRDAFENCMDKAQLSPLFSAKVKSARFDNAGNQHLRITQWYQGLRVIGAEVIVHINRAGEIYRINGAYLPSLDISIEPEIEKTAALAIGRARHKGARSLEIEQEPILVIYASRLAYHLILSFQGDGSGQWHYYLDATNGNTLFRYNNRQSG